MGAGGGLEDAMAGLAYEAEVTTRRVVGLDEMAPITTAVKRIQTPENTALLVEHLLNPKSVFGIDALEQVFSIHGLKKAEHGHKIRLRVEVTQSGVKSFFTLKGRQQAKPLKGHKHKCW